MRPTSILTIALLIGISWAAESPGADRDKFDDAVDPLDAAGPRVRKLFKDFRAGTYIEQIEFPNLKWDDIPDLLSLGGSRRTLKTFPRQASSSQYEPACSEGMVALWLIEGLRHGGKLSSNNALCLPDDLKGSDWSAQSEKNHERVLKAYQDWWSRAKNHSEEKARADNPLDGYKVHWF